MQPLLTCDKNGLYCREANVYIDPWRKVDRAIITHGHSDHARPGHKAYICTEEAMPTLNYRIGRKSGFTAYPFRKSFMINGVKFSFHRAGHIIGSAQVRVEYMGEVWVVSGDYKIEEDALSGPFEPVRCHTFITESTFGTPAYRWNPAGDVFREINTWWEINKLMGRSSILTAYSLGKAQRLLRHVDASIGPIFVHPTIDKVNAIIRKQGIYLPPTRVLHKDVSIKELHKALVISPSSIFATDLISIFDDYVIGAASGWMAHRKTRRNRSVHRGFALSDHADWDGLLQAIQATEAEQILVTHGPGDVLARHLCEMGYDASVLKTRFERESPPAP